jgi:hypothetical protein
LEGYSRWFVFTNCQKALIILLENIIAREAVMKKDNIQRILEGEGHP